MTFCFSDIADSTALWESQPEAMAEALVRHDALIADAVEARGGSLIKSMGESDSTVSVFDSAPAAVAAALAANRALTAEEWAPGIRIVARWGIHTGEAERRDADYIGPTVNLAARVRSQADGDEILLSSVTSELVAAHLPQGCSLVDLGPHRLKGLGTPERILALAGPGVRTPLSAAECPYRGLLAFEPGDRGFFFGREEVAAKIIGRLAPGGLLAVVGASGSGKSSVLRAGVIAAVRAGEVDGLRHASLLTPGSAPALDVDDEPDRLVVVDQFEELFTLCDDADRRRAFIDALLRLALRGRDRRARRHLRQAQRAPRARARRRRQPGAARADGHRRARARDHRAGPARRAQARTRPRRADPARRRRRARRAAPALARAARDLGAPRRPHAHPRGLPRDGRRRLRAGPHRRRAGRGLPDEQRQLVRGVSWSG